jgi:nucleoside-diphosphate-sugar epimerase
VIWALTRCVCISSIPTIKKGIDLSSTILVTGSGGFIGRAVTNALNTKLYSLRQGYRSRVPTDAVNAIACDLDQPSQIAAAVDKADVVVHCAFADEKAMVLQCQALLEAMETASVTKLVYFSSIAVNGEGEGPIGFYAEQKAKCEDLIHQWCARSTDNSAVILRPGIVYGAGSHLWIDKLIQRINAGVWGDFGATADGPATLIHVDDLAVVTTASVDYLLSGKQGAVVMDVVGPDVPTWNQYFHALAARLSDRPLRKIGAFGHVALPAIGFVAKVLKRLGIPLLRNAALAPTKGELAMFARKVPYDATIVPRLLGYQPKIGLKEGLARSLPNQETRPAP